MTEIQKILEQQRDWLSKSEGMLSQEKEFLREDLAANTLGALDSVSDSLGILATYFGINGVLTISNGDFSGWKNVSKSISYRYWALKIRARTFSETAFLSGIKIIPNLTNQMGNAGCLLAGFIAADRDDMALEVADILSGMLTVKGAVDSSFLKRRRFEPFIMWLYSIYSGKGVSSRIKIDNLGVYQKVIESWDNVDELSTAISEVCDYHLSNAEDTGGDWDPEFKNSPFDLVPLEVQAIYVVRKKLGLVTPEVNHSLVSLAPSSVEDLVLIPDEVFSQVESAYNVLFRR